MHTMNDVIEIVVICPVIKMAVAVKQFQFDFLHGS